MKRKKLDTIIWDWNGTLLDDVDLCLESINRLLGDRGHPTLDKAAYRDIFTFPVKDYYVRAGFDFTLESFDKLAIEFIDLYRSGLDTCKVFPDAKPTLERLSEKGYRQFLISAMEHQFLMETLRDHGMDHYFDDFSGIQDHYADGKAAMASEFSRSKGIDPQRTLFIGDTLHDYEVANQLGMHCLLVANGHQSDVRLLSAGCEVVGGLGEAVSRFSEMVEGHQGNT